MMHGPGKSDSSVVPAKPPNKAAEPAAEAGEGSGLAKGNSPERNALRTQRRDRAHSALERVRQAARRDRKQRFTALLHHVYDVERLRAAYLALQRDAAPGIDGETWRHYGEALEENLRDLSARLRRGAYRAKPVRRAYIAKADGRPRPLGVPTLEDKLVQRAAAEVLSAVYEPDFVRGAGLPVERRGHAARHQVVGSDLTQPDDEELDQVRFGHPGRSDGPRPRPPGRSNRHAGCAGRPPCAAAGSSTSRGRPDSALRG